MTKSLQLLTALLFAGILGANAQLFPKVSKPESNEASMLVLQFGHTNDGKLETVTNLNFSGWAPAVINANGEIVPFRKYDAGADFTNIYYAENLAAGTYKLVGFYHVYIDYSKLDEMRKGNPDKMTKYAPYENLSYHVKQLFPLQDTVTVQLEANKVMTFGTYAVKYAWVGGLAGTTDDRWKANEEKTEVTTSKPDDNTVLRYIKTWATPAWKKWNAKNDVSPL
ncbi:MAG TPA: hypothetical protein PLC17_10300 [Tenuifilaceae bacterium]|nr:hypothetical protein [Tenuifilaceae bacterium]HQB79455.1 hypothetical protein [Tenuifilaceae bacterium]